jgi:hypothetical protein
MWRGNEAIRQTAGEETAARDMPDLELALLRRGVDALGSAAESCERCGRRPLIGERIYAHPRLGLLCELCRASDGERTESHVVHGPEFGHTIKLLDRRPAAA